MRDSFCERVPLKADHDHARSAPSVCLVPILPKLRSAASGRGNLFHRPGEQKEIPQKIFDGYRGGGFFSSNA